MHDVNEKTYETLKALDGMCDVLMKALPSQQGSMLSQIKASPNVPDYSPEQIIQARGGSEAPLVDEPSEPTEGIPQETMPVAPAETDLSQYTPEKLHEILTRALPHIVKILSQGR